MLSPQANLQLLQRTSWSGYVYIAFLMVGILPLARFFPSQPPSWDANQITHVYHSNVAGIRGSLIYASLADEDPDPIIPRWVGWFNVFFVLDLIPLSIIFFFQTGPFAWNGLFGFYLPFATFWVWFFVMTYTVRRALHRLDDVPASSVAYVRAA
ncbi:hypothetical protein OK015_19515 [Mycobacterium sp. Aquia_216]|uniref:hypothetical protein n=1 Tax=Mycobacterium sp. Aquia_216 TaxID=2991729 RepID=UPI00227AD5E1|nr:hypothetical protein [Mycobacterium sp. Aquia_216]WAJ43386.1 hypothetical protein OK015_19515 [Mycobacterium sp. Aquia_216]